MQARNPASDVATPVRVIHNNNNSSCIPAASAYLYKLWYHNIHVNNMYACKPVSILVHGTGTALLHMHTRTLLILKLIGALPIDPGRCEQLVHCATPCRLTAQRQWNDRYTNWSLTEFEDFSRTFPVFAQFSRIFKDIQGQLSISRIFQDFQDLCGPWITHPLPSLSERTNSVR